MESSCYKLWIRLAGAVCSMCLTLCDWVYMYQTCLLIFILTQFIKQTPYYNIGMPHYNISMPHYNIGMAYYNIYSQIHYDLSILVSVGLFLWF